MNKLSAKAITLISTLCKELDFENVEFEKDKITFRKFERLMPDKLIKVSDEVKEENKTPGNIKEEKELMVVTYAYSMNGSVIHNVNKNAILELEKGFISKLSGENILVSDSGIDLEETSPTIMVGAGCLRLVYGINIPILHACLSCISSLADLPPYSKDQITKCLFTEVQAKSENIARYNSLNIFIFELIVDHKYKTFKFNILDAKN